MELERRILTKNLKSHIISILLIIAFIALFSISASADYVHTNNTLYFDGEGGSSNFYDLSGLGVNNVNSGISQAVLPSGVYYYDFPLDNVNYAYFADQDMGSKISIDIIFKIADNTSYIPVIDDMNYVNKGYSIRVQSTGKLQALVALTPQNDLETFNSNTVLKTNTWYYAAFTYNGTDGVWYVKECTGKTISNIAADSDTPITGSVNSQTGNNAFIGYGASGGHMGMALLREYHDLALSPTQVTQNYNNDQWRASNINRKKTVVTVGDSLTYGIYGNGNSWPIVLTNRDSDNIQTVIDAVGGSTAAMRLADWNTKVTALHPDYIIISLAYNDLGTNPTVYYNEISTMITYSKSNSSMPILGLCTASGGQPTILTYNNWTISTGQANNIPVIDFWNATNDPNNPNYLLPAYNSGDDVHCNSLGYTAMGNNISLDIFNTTIGFTNTSITTVEGTDISLTVKLNYESSNPVTVHIATIDGSAIAGTDYTSISQDLTFAKCETSKTVSLSIKDSQSTTSKQFTVQLSNPVNATIGDNSTCTITINPSNNPGYNAGFMSPLLDLIDAFTSLMPSIANLIINAGILLVVAVIGSGIIAFVKSFGFKL